MEKTIRLNQNELTEIIKNHFEKQGVNVLGSIKFNVTEEVKTEHCASLKKFTSAMVVIADKSSND